MIFIENKKALKKFIRESCSDYLPDHSPIHYPLYLEMVGADWSCENRIYEYVYIADLQRMVATIEKGKEF